MVRENVYLKTGISCTHRRICTMHEAFVSELQFMVDDSVMCRMEKDLFDLRKL